jgi:streptogramin lyase
VQEYDTATGAFVKTFASLIGSSAEGLAFGPNGDLFVTSIEDNAVEEFDGITGVFVKTVNTAPIVLPLGLTFGPDGNLFVGNANGFVDELDQSGAVIKTFLPQTGSIGAIALTFGPTAAVPEPPTFQIATIAVLAGLGVATRCRTRWSTV